jgi:quinol monooxygenase YgiN
MGGSERPYKMTIVLGQIEFHPADFESAKGLARTLVRETVKEDGCVKYAFAEDLSRPACFQLSECWRDSEALKAHFLTPHIAAYREGLKPLRILSRVVKKYEAAEPADL